ncbi:hypothetical protein [Dactylosporangium sp. NPDC000521]|uniref:hypothetical protein n=1 Tax=Dactylosporangium sp. NPDC000521 TaxID=3363975 RepID=UPI0036946D7A
MTGRLGVSVAWTVGDGVGEQDVIYVVHPDPVARGRENYIAHADLGAFGLPGQLEQLWLKPLEDGDCRPGRQEKASFKPSTVSGT